MTDLCAGILCWSSDPVSPCTQDMTETQTYYSISSGSGIGSPWISPGYLYWVHIHPPLPPPPIKMFASSAPLSIIKFTPRHKFNFIVELAFLNYMVKFLKQGHIPDFGLNTDFLLYPELCFSREVDLPHKFWAKREENVKSWQDFLITGDFVKPSILLLHHNPVSVLTILHNAYTQIPLLTFIGL